MAVEMAGQTVAQWEYSWAVEWVALTAGWRAVRKVALMVAWRVEC